MAPLGLFAAQPLGLALGLVGIVVDDGVPEVEGDRLDLVIHERFPPKRPRRERCSPGGRKLASGPVEGNWAGPVGSQGREFPLRALTGPAAGNAYSRARIDVPEPTCAFPAC